MAGLLCEEEVLEVDNVKYCGYCKYHFSKMVSPAWHWRQAHGRWALPVLGGGREKDSISSLSGALSMTGNGLQPEGCR